jgi:hypothetical protein
MDISSKIMFFVFFMSSLNILRHIWKILIELRKEEPQKVQYTKTDIVLLGCSVSYILTTLFTGFS